MSSINRSIGLVEDDVTWTRARASRRRKRERETQRERQREREREREREGNLFSGGSRASQRINQRERDSHRRSTSRQCRSRAPRTLVVPVIFQLFRLRICCSSDCISERALRYKSTGLET